MTNNCPAQGMRLLLFIFAKNEESQLEKTVRGLQAVCPPESVAGMVLFLAPNATKGCLRTAEGLQNAGFLIPIEIFQQASSNIPACVKAVLDGKPDVSHVMHLASDYFMESSAIAGLIESAAQDCGTVYKFSRTVPGGGFSPGYRHGMVPLYRLFCACVRVLYGCGITDPAFFVMVAPVRLFQLVQFRHTSMLYGQEWMYALLRGKTPIIEIPAVHLPRTEMDNSTTIYRRLRYMSIAVCMRFASKKSIWLKGDLR